MQYWMDVVNGEWGMMRGASSFTEVSSEPADPQFNYDTNGVLVLDKDAFLKLYQSLENVSVEPVFTSVNPFTDN